MRFTLISIIAAAVTLAACASHPAVDGSGGGANHRRMAAFHADLEDLIDSPQLAPTNVGVAVWSLDRRDWVYLHNADKLYVPASNAKLLIAASALRAFGPAKRFRTSVLTDAAVDDSVVHGSVHLVAGGAPDLRTSDVALLAERLRATGIRSIEGPVVVDVTLFDSTAFGPGWMWDEGPYSYNAPLSAAMLNDNAITVTVRPGLTIGDTVRVVVSPRYAGVPIDVRAVTRADTASGPSLEIDRPGPALTIDGTMPVSAPPTTVRRTVPSPASYLANCFVGELRDVGISVGDSVLFSAAPDSGVVELAAVRSATMDELVRRFLKQSHNLTGEALLKHLGLAYRGEGSWTAGLQAVREIMQTFAGIDSTAYRLADGSGISRYTELSPRQIALVLRAAADEFTTSPEFLAALPIAGVDGTLSRRLATAAEPGLIRGKTGTMTGVSGISGVMETYSGERIVYSILMNGFPGSTWSGRYAQDRIIEKLFLLPERASIR